MNILKRFIQKQFSKMRRIPHLFGKLIVFWCISIGTMTSLWALRILSHTGHDPSALLGVILAFFGGELMVLCLKTILKDSKERNNDERENQ